jgi:broad specificity phosphatase PhoE
MIEGQRYTPASEHTSLYVVRHAQSEANVHGWQNTPSPSITEHGRQQARERGIGFREQGVVFAAAYTSGKPRTMQTAAGILEGMDAGDIPVHVIAGLHEKGEGKYGVIPEGVTQKEVSTALRTTLRTMPDTERWDYVPEIPGINPETYETEHATAERVHNALSEIVVEHSGENVLVVSHAMTMRAHLVSLQTDAMSETGNVVFAENTPGNTGYYVVDAERSEHGITALRLQTKHLIVP